MAGKINWLFLTVLKAGQEDVLQWEVPVCELQAAEEKLESQACDLECKLQEGPSIEGEERIRKCPTCLLHVPQVIQINQMIEVE